MYTASLDRAWGDFVRRFLLSALIIGSCGFWVPSKAAAEARLIAVIMANSQPRYHDIHSVFVKNAGDFCGKDCRIYVQTPNADIMSLRNSVRKAIALGAELIVAYGPLATIAAQAEVPPVPTLFVDVYDPVGLKIVSAKTRTGRNMTGIRGDAPVQGLFKYFTDTVEVRKLGFSTTYTARRPCCRSVSWKKVANVRASRVVCVEVGDSHNYLAPLGTLPDDVDGVFVASSEQYENQLDYVLGYTNARRIPVITQLAGAADDGAFMVLETSTLEQGEKLAEMAGQVLSGTDINQIPMHKPHNISFVINLKRGQGTGIKVPIQTLSVASRVVR